MGEYRTSYVTSAINVVDAPISRKSPEQWRAIVEYKGLAFVHDNNYASIAYDLKSARAVFDPDLAGGNGGFRCPVGTRYGGQITDRYGRGCGFGVARRLVNAIGDGARRAERGLDKRRERRVRRRNARVGRQLGIRGYTAPGRGGRGMATRLDDFADRRDRRQRRGGSNGPGMATRLEEFADRRDRRQGRGGRGIATRLEEFADRRDRRQGRGGRGFATRLEDFADRDDERRGIKPRKRRDVAPGLENGGQGVLRPDAQNRRSRRTDAVAETATNRPRPKKPSTPVAVVKPPQRRQRGQQIDVNNLDANGKKRLNDRLDRERDALNTKWRTRLGGEDPTPEKIRAYVKAREQRSSPGYVNTLKAMERDHAILNGEDRLDRVNDLAPSVRKRLAEGTPQAAVPARPRPARPRPARPREPRPATVPEAAVPDVPPAPRVPSAPPAPPSAPGAPGNAPQVPNAETVKPPAAPAPYKPRRNILGLVARKDKRNRAKLGSFDKNGFADPKRVEVGNKGISTQANASKYLKDGGDMADVPDDFLAAAMEANLGPGKRFTVIRKASSANSPTLVKDTKTGQGFLIKKYSQNSVGFNEDVNDLIGNHIAERFGFPNGQMRFAGKLNGPANSPKSSVPVVFELGNNFVDGSLESPNPNRLDIKNLVRATLFDYAIINSDRHGGNYFNAVKDGKHYFFPIDQSLGFNARKGRRHFSGEANAAGFGNWLSAGQGGARNNMKAVLQGKMDAAGRREVISEIKKLQNDLRKAERQESSSNAIGRVLGQFPGRKYATDEGRSHKDAAKRIQWLINARPEEIANVLERGR